MRILMFGREGQLATEVRRRAGAAQVVALGRGEADFADPAACAAVAAARLAEGFDAVVNAAAYTAVDRAESEPDLARRVNAETPGALAAAAAAAGAPFVHVSTDYVFDGAPEAGARAEDAATGPLGAYGASKLAGERAVAAAGGAHAILRASWVFSAHGSNFVKTMLRLGRERAEIGVVADQIGGPTPAADLADAALAVAARLAAGRGEGGVFHFAGAPDVSWADFAEAIFAGAGLSVAVRRIATADYPTPARRPLNSRLDCGRIAAVHGIARPDWRRGLDATLAELGARA